MNIFDYFFENTQTKQSKFILNKEDSVSYEKLFDNSKRFSNYLRKISGENRNILIIVPNSVYFVTAYLAILKSGNIAVPLNPEIEPENYSYIAQLCESDLVITTNHLSKRFPINSLRIINELFFNEIIESEHKAKGDVEEFDSNRTAELIFTSGSTGKPKGVVISHENIIANTNSILSFLKLNEDDIMLTVLPFYYCYGLSLLHTHLRVGGSLVFNNFFIMLGRLFKDLQHYKCTGFAGVPSHFQILLRKSDSFSRLSFPHLRYVTQAGGKLFNIFIEEFTRTFPNIKFYVMYGQTEATARLSYLPPEMLAEKPGSCGKGIPGVELMVVNNKGKHVKPGNTGEIIAKGKNIMKGYYKDTIGTSIVLRNGWLYTGDLATVDEDGYIFLTARKKEIIKVGGRRISTKEIEETILKIPDIIDCSIETIDDEVLGEAIKANVITGDISKITSEDIKRLCAQRLAPYKIPKIVNITDRIKLSATGKKVKESGS